MKAGWRGALSIAALTAGPLACTEPTFVDGERSRDGAAADTQRDAEDREDEGEERDATSASNGTSAVASLDASLTASGDGATEAIQDAGETAFDAGTNLPLDGGNAVDAGVLPDWAKPLIGTYAKRSVAFSYDYDIAFGIAFNTRNIEDSILTISQKGNVLELSIQLCRYEVQVQSAPPFYIKNAAAIPPMKGRIVLGAVDTFSSEPMAQQLGFDRARAECAGGATRTKYADQTWIASSNMCQCSSGRLPDALSDCRLTDGDGDGKAGITGRGQIAAGAAPVDVAMVFESALTFVDGQIRANKNHTLREVRSQGQSCIDARDWCSFGNNQLCPGGTTQLVHQERVTCASFPDQAFDALPDYPGNVDCRVAGK